MKNWIKILLLAIVDFVIIWWFVGKMDNDPSSFIAIIILVPLAVGINLIIALILYFIKKEYSKLFLINSLISAVFMFFIFDESINRNLWATYDSWTFKRYARTYQISLYKPDTTFSITYSVSPSSSTGVLYGKYFQSKEGIILSSDSADYTIKNNHLYGFFYKNDSIELKKVNY